MLHRVFRFFETQAGLFPIKLDRLDLVAGKQRFANRRGVIWSGRAHDIAMLTAIHEKDKIDAGCLMRPAFRNF